MAGPDPSPSPFALVVEASILVRMDAVNILEDAGFRVLDVGTGDEAIRLLRQHGPAFTLLFTAVGPPGPQDGFALARMAASDHPHISVVVASGHDKPGPGDLPDSACFIEKPFSTGIVREHLRRIMPEDRKPAPLRAKPVPTH